MANYIYMRVSSAAQDYQQQKTCIEQFLNGRVKIDGEVVEKISGTVKHTDRKLADLLADCKRGDTVYVSELSRLGRCMSDLFSIVTETSERGIKLVQCKDGSQIENESIGGKALLFALSLAAEIEVMNIRQRTKMGLEARKELIRAQGYFLNKQGEICTHLGRPKGAYTGKATTAASIERMNRRINWATKSVAFIWVQQQLAKGKPRKLILEEFDELHRQQPEVYCTRTGKPLTRATLSLWAQMGNKLIVAGEQEIKENNNINNASETETETKTKAATPLNNY